LCLQFSNSLKLLTCKDEQGTTKITSKCQSISSPLNNCVDYYNVELNTCGFESVAAKNSFCSNAANSNDKCCGGTGQNAGQNAGQNGTAGQLGTGQNGMSGQLGNNTGVGNTQPSTTTNDSSSTSTDSSSTATETSKQNKKKGGSSFFTSKGFLIFLVVFAIFIGLLGYFYYVGSKDEKEENMRNLENGGNNNHYNNNNYGQTQTVEINKNQNLGVNNDYNDYNNRSPYEYKPSYDIPTSTADPFSDNNRVDPINASYNDVQNSVSYQNAALVAAPVQPRNAENPFDSPKLENPENDYDNQINKSMQELSKNFPVDDMPTPSVVKITSIEKPQQSNTNIDDGTKKEDNPDDILKPSMVRMTNIETPVPSNTIPADKDISIGDDVLKPSMVKLTEIETPQETSINNEAQEGNNNGEAADEEPKKAVVNMIDLKTPDSNEALNAGNITPSILVTSADGKVTEGTSQEEEIPEEYSEMPEPRPFRAIHAYEPQIDDELRLVVDNEIDVLYEYDDGWCWAINKTTGEQGACPLLCLVSAKEEASGEREWEKEMDVMKVPGRRESMLSNSFDTSRLSFQKKIDFKY
jgi:hypothetical protein